MSTTLTVWCDCGGEMVPVEEADGGDSYVRQKYRCGECEADGKVLVGADGSSYLFGSVHLEPRS